MRLKRRQIIEREKEDKKKNSIFSWVRAIAFALVIGLSISMFVKPVLVRGTSMYPTVSPHDYIITSGVSYVFGQPRFGDIIVFKTNMHTLNGDEKDLIKRVIGLPGDTVEISGGKVYLNNEELNEEYVRSGATPGDVPKMKIEEGYVFVMGDNRPSSKDSRDESIGQIAISDIKGKAIIRLFPFDKIGEVE